MSAFNIHMVMANNYRYPWDFWEICCEKSKEVFINSGQTDKDKTMEFFYRLHDKTLLFSSNISLTVILNSLWNSRLFVHDFFCGEKITRGGGVLDHDLE